MTTCPWSRAMRCNFPSNCSKSCGFRAIECRMQMKNAKYKIGIEKTNFDFKRLIIVVCQIWLLHFALCIFQRLVKIPPNFVQVLSTQLQTPPTELLSFLYPYPRMERTILRQRCRTVSIDCRAERGACGSQGEGKERMKPQITQINTCGDVGKSCGYPLFDL